MDFVCLTVALFLIFREKLRGLDMSSVTVGDLTFDNPYNSPGFEFWIIFPENIENAPFLPEL